MPVFTNLDERACAAPFDPDEYRRRLPNCRASAARICPVHVTGRGRPFDVTVVTESQAIPISSDRGYCTDLRFDFAFQRSVDERLIRELSTGN